MAKTSINAKPGGRTFNGHNFKGRNKKPVTHDAAWLFKRLAKECARHKMHPIEVLDACVRLAGAGAVQMGLGEEYKKAMVAFGDDMEKALVKQEDEQNGIVKMDFGKGEGQ